MRQIRAEELQHLLENPETADRAVAEFFTTTDEKGPLRLELELRPDVEIVYPDEAIFKSIRLWPDFLGLANSFRRHQRLKAYRRKLEESPDSIRIVSEGDSWFQHPTVKDVIDHLIEDGLFRELAVYDVGAAGDDVWEMVLSAEFIDAVRSEKTRAVLISAGGNDILGAEFHNFVADYSDGSDIERLVVMDVFQGKLEQIRDRYAFIVSRLAEEGVQVPLVGHTYGYARQKPGKWLAPTMAGKGIPEAEQKAVVRYMVDQFHDRVLVPTQAAYKNFVFADVRRELLLLEDWHDEIHPNIEGFGHVALQIYRRMKELWQR
jgi:lysophospholipase L1-like esterase